MHSLQLTTTCYVAITSGLELEINNLRELLKYCENTGNQGNANFIRKQLNDAETVLDLFNASHSAAITITAELCKYRNDAIQAARVDRLNKSNLIKIK